MSITDQSSRLDKLWEQVVRYFGDDERRIDHARQVLRYATWILEVDDADRETVRAAAMVHDIGIPEAERKYGAALGPYQELEGPPVARRLMEEVGFEETLIDHVCRIVASHHSPGEVTTPEFFVLWDADWLVNLPALFGDRPVERLAKIVGKVFRTRLGKLLATRMFLAGMDSYFDAGSDSDADCDSDSSASLALVSGCLAGQKCRYDGGHWSVDALRAAAEAGEMVPVCPERLGGLPAPRGAAEIVGGTAEDVLDGKARVMDCYGQDVTGPFVAGAQEVLALAGALRVDRAILKEHSPSCGSSSVYDGTFTRAKVVGEGVCAALLRRNGIKVEGAG